MMRRRAERLPPLCTLLCAALSLLGTEAEVVVDKNHKVTIAFVGK